MFTGIVETLGTLVDVKTKGANKIFSVKSDITPELQIDQSVSHNGVCLTVISLENHTYKVELIDETLAKTNMSQLKVGDKINLERAMLLSDRLDGHMVQGHVDTTANVISKVDQDGSTLFTFSYPSAFRDKIVEKGSICINGVSLTLINVDSDKFSVAIIPYTMENTTFSSLAVGDTVNIEFDIIAKYLSRFYEVYREDT